MRGEAAARRDGRSGPPWGRPRPRGPTGTRRRRPCSTRTSDAAAGRPDAGRPPKPTAPAHPGTVAPGRHPPGPPPRRRWAVCGRCSTRPRPSTSRTAPAGAGCARLRERRRVRSRPAVGSHRTWSSRRTTRRSSSTGRWPPRGARRPPPPTSDTTELDRDRGAGRPDVARPGAAAATPGRVPVGEGQGQGSTTTLMASPLITASIASPTRSSGSRWVIRSSTGTAPVAIRSRARRLWSGLEPFAPTSDSSR
jgi:hypothetical protein